VCPLRFLEMAGHITMLAMILSAQLVQAACDPVHLIPKEAVEGKLHDLVCKVMKSDSSKEEIAVAVCEKVRSKIKFLPEGACETAAKLLWEREEEKYCKPTVTEAAELRRWDGSSNCTGKYAILNSDNMNECTSYLIPAPASIWVEKQNATVYSSYHYQGVTDCSGNHTHLGDFVVGTCENLGGYSQMRVWVEPKPVLLV